MLEDFNVKKEKLLDDVDKSLEQGLLMDLLKSTSRDYQRPSTSQGRK